jgi:hypothetical protein
MPTPCAHWTATFEDDEYDPDIIWKVCHDCGWWFPADRCPGKKWTGERCRYRADRCGNHNAEVKARRAAEYKARQDAYVATRGPLVQCSGATATGARCGNRFAADMGCFCRLYRGQT